jgi:hypothetical protein
LRAAFAVADVNEDEAAEVAAGMDPAGQRDGLPDVCRAQFVAMMRAFHSVTVEKSLRKIIVRVQVNEIADVLIFQTDKVIGNNSRVRRAD